MKLPVSKGVAYMLLATFFFSLMQVFVKLVPHIPAVEVVLFRSVVSFGLSIILLRANRTPILGRKRTLLFLRGSAGAIALVLYFITLQKIPLATAVTLQFLSPIFTALLGVLIVQEKLTWKQLSFFGLSFMGVLVIQGVDPRLTSFYLLIGLGGSFFAGVAYNLIRKIGTQDHPLVIILYFPLVTIPIAGVYCLFDWVTPQGLDWFYLILVGICTQIAQYYMTISYQSDRLAKVAGLNFIGIIYALGFGYILFGEVFGWASYMGMGLVLMGVILNVLFKSKKEDQPISD